MVENSNFESVSLEPLEIKPHFYMVKCKPSSDHEIDDLQRSFNWAVIKCMTDVFSLALFNQSMLYG